MLEWTNAEQERRKPCASHASADANSLLSDDEVGSSEFDDLEHDDFRAQAAAREGGVLEELLQYLEYAQKKLKEVKASISVVEQGKEVTKISIVWVRSQMEDHKNMLHDAKQQLDVFVTKLKDLGDGDSTKAKA